MIDDDRMDRAELAGAVLFCAALQLLAAMSLVACLR
jgi:hypothetical protein